MVSLLEEFPYQCVMLSMGESRCNKKQYLDRQKAMNSVFKECINKSPKMKEIIENYKYLADNFAKLSNEKKCTGDQLDLRTFFPDFLNYLESGKKRRSTTKAITARPRIPLFFKYLDSPFREISQDTILIYKIDPACRVSFLIL